MTNCPPTWVQDAVFYQIFADRFAASARVVKPANLEPWDSPPTNHGFKGGDLLGVVEHLDRLSDLGVDALYLTPIFQSAANHRYHTHDYYHVDPLLGGDAALRELLDAAHARGMRVVLDGVFNHASRGFFPFNHILENGPQSPYLDWFTVHGFPLNAYSRGKPRYEAWWGLRELPKLNTDNPQVREFLMQVAEHWLRFGIDGWRLDVPLDIRTPGFWSEFRRRVKAVNPEAYIVAEIWEAAPEWLRGDHFDGLMNYVLQRACLGFFGGLALDNALWHVSYPIQPLTGRQFVVEIERLLATYDWPTNLAQLNLLGSHDVPRFVTMVGGDPRRLRLAVLFQMAFPGAPCVYYGDEIGMAGGRDPDNRRALPWDESQWDHELRDWFRRCIRLRRDHPALRSGEWRTLSAGESICAFARCLPQETLLVALNAGDEPAQLTLPVREWAADGAALRPLLDGEPVVVRDGQACLTLAPLSGAVLDLGA